MTHTKQTVYVPVKVDSEKVIYCEDIDKVEKQEGYFFTPEQLNQLLSDVIEDALVTAAEEAKIIKSINFGWEKVDKKSITMEQRQKRLAINYKV